METSTKSLCKLVSGRSVPINMPSSNLVMCAKTLELAADVLNQDDPNIIFD